jgi:hypothetical protein
MIDLFGNRANETYTYRSVSWPDFVEGADLGNVTAGNVELSAFSDLKATCSFQFEGGEEPNTNDLVRIYYSFDDDNGEHSEFCIGTFFIGYADANYRLNGDTLIASGRVNGWSTLKVLQDVQIGYAYTVSAGTYAIAKAIEIIQNAGLPVNVANESTYQLSNDHTFQPKDTLLTMVNWLCTAADYQAPYPDAYGTIQIQQYIDPSERATVATFKDDGQSIMYPDISIENDWQEIPNVYRLYYSTDEIAIRAEARNISGSKASLDRRGGRELVEVADVSELAGADSSAMAANLESMAAAKLLNNSQEIERVELSHPYIPLVANDAVQVNYANRAWAGNVQNIKIDLAPATQCNTVLRRFIPSTITVQTSSVIDYESTS